jgi:hypothetical protein
MKKVKRLAGSWTFILARDRAEGVKPEDQTVFRLRPMTGPERDVVKDDVSRTVLQEDGLSAVVTREQQVARRICLEHIESVQNFPAGAAEPWPDDREARAHYLEMLDDAAVFEIGEEIFTKSTIGEPEKNSSGPEPTLRSGDASPALSSTTAGNAIGTPP